jgi:glycosyltransferase involved in cell wall biosynthesis
VARVDVVIPTYNAPPDRLADAVRSGLRSAKVGRVIVVDDGSEPAAALPEELAREARVVLVRQENAGPSAARNRGLDLVHGEFALLLDDDDRLEGRGVEALLEAADEHGAWAVVAARFEQAGEVCVLRGVPPQWAGGVLPAAEDVFWPTAIFGASGLLVRRAALEKGVRFDPGLMIGEDRDFLRRVGDLGPIAVCARPVLTVALHEQSKGNLTSASRLSRRVADHVVILERHHSARSDAALKAATVWLLNQVAKQRPMDEGAWERLAWAARARGWRVPLKARLRARAGRLARA